MIGGTLPVIAMIGFLLLVGFGDGLGYSLVALTGQRSPWIFVLPILLLSLVGYLVMDGPRALRRLDWCIASATVAFGGLIVVSQYLFVRDFYLLGLFQLLLFVLCAVLIFGVFVSAPTWLDAALRRALPVVHYFLSGYVVAAYVAWQLLRWDPSLRAVLTGTSSSAVAYYGFRPSGFSAEPQWAAIALAASYLGIHYLVPRQRLNAFVALVVGAEAVQSGTGYLFVAIVAAVFAASALRGSMRHINAVAIAGATFALIGFVTILWQLRERVNLSDVLVISGNLAQSLPFQIMIATALLFHQLRELRRGRQNAGELLVLGALLAGGLMVAAYGAPPPLTGVTPPRSASPSAAAVASPSASPTPSRSATSSVSPTRTGSASVSAPASATIVQSARPSTVSPSPVATRTPSPSPTPSPSRTPLPTPTPPVSIVQPPLERATSIFSGQDPSAAMRLTSGQVAWRVIETSFPVGVGYGNFREHAVYPPAFVKAMPGLAEQVSYKSDFFLLNYAAELGVLGLILVTSFGILLMWTRHVLIVAFGALLAGVSGTLLLPPVLVVAAIAGLLLRDRLHRPPSPGGGRWRLLLVARTSVPRGKLEAS